MVTTPSHCWPPRKSVVCVDNVAPLNETSCIAYLGEDISLATSERVAAAARVIRSALGDRLVDIIPSYASILVTIDPERISILDCCALLENLEINVSSEAAAQRQGQLCEIPAYYGPEVALDMDEVMRQTGLQAEEIIRLHAEVKYRIFAIGFAPAFCFLASINERLQLPRKASPRQKVPRGSVAIAGQQTAVYPRETPGGWHILGRTPVDMLALCNTPEQPLQVGDQIQFHPVDRETFLNLGGELS